MASVTMKILSIFLIISLLNCGILSVLPDDISDEYPSVCEIDENCSDTERCINNLCADACTEVICDLSQMCVHGPAHNGHCTCRKHYDYHPNKCVPSCHDDRDCDSSRECKPDENNYHHCGCRSDYIVHKTLPELPCGLRCEVQNRCPAETFCSIGYCYANQEDELRFSVKNQITL